MSDYEAFVRKHLTPTYNAARSVLGSDEEAALVAQAICLYAYQAQEEREVARW